MRRTSASVLRIEGRTRAMDRWPWIAGCVLWAGCALGPAERSPAPAPTNIVRGPLVVQADFPLDEHHPLIGELAELRERVAATLQAAPEPQPVQVRVFASSDGFHSHLAERFPHFPVRRAFFVKQHGRLEVCAQWGERVGEDLRHETTHAYLHALIDNLPLWLDEGLAEYFETPPAAGGWHSEHAELLQAEWRRGRWRPDLRRLEALTASGEMTQLDYAESWAWTYFLLNTAPPRRALLQRHFHVLRRHEPTPPLSVILQNAEPHAAEAMIAALVGGMGR